jgi:hypothetical protein
VKRLSLRAHYLRKEEVHMATTTPKLQVAAGRTVYVAVPRGISNDIDKMFRLTRSVLGRLGCDGCHSGFDLRYLGGGGDPLFIGNEKSEIAGF